MDDSAVTDGFDACSERTRVAAQLLTDHQDCLRRSHACLALSRKLLAQPVYPVNHVPPHNPFDLSSIAIKPGPQPGSVREL